MRAIDRRQVLKGLAGLALGAGAGCWSSEEPRRAVTEIPLGDPRETLKVRGYRGLAELPYFELDAEGRLRPTVDGLVPGIDFHTHLAFNMVLAPRVDLLARTPEVAYLIACDTVKPPCIFDLDVYLNEIADHDMLHDMEAEIRGMLLLGGRAAHTFTIPNLVDEMDRVGFERAVLLPIAPGLPRSGHLTEWWSEAARASGKADRLVMFASVHPLEANAADELRAYAANGVRGIKLHPPMQRFYPDDPKAMRLYETCAELGMTVFFHAGRAGIEPGFVAKYAVMKHYLAPAREFPGVNFVFGHAGARDWPEAIPIAREQSNVWLDVHGQGLTALRAMLEQVGPERLLFGSDWPWYPIAASLARVFLATDRDATVRNMIIGDNARRLLAAA